MSMIKGNNSIKLYPAPNNANMDANVAAAAEILSSEGQVKKKVKKKERRLDFADCIITTPPPPQTFQTLLEVLKDIAVHS